MEKTIEEIAKELGTSVQVLLEEYGDAATVINKYKNKELKLLTD